MYVNTVDVYIVDIYDISTLFLHSQWDLFMSLKKSQI